MRGGFFTLVGFLTLVMGFGALRCFAGLLGSGMVQSKTILLEYRSGERSGVLDVETAYWYNPRRRRFRYSTGQSGRDYVWLSKGISLSIKASASCRPSATSSVSISFS